MEGIDLEPRGVTITNTNSKSKKLRPDQWAWLNAKLGLVTWAILFFAFTPLKVEAAVTAFLAALISLTVLFGVGLSVYGLIQSLSLNIRRALNGFTFELAGLWTAFGGLTSYFIIQFFLSFGIDGDQRIALTAFAYTMCSFVIVRIVGVTTHRKKVMS